MVDNLLSITLHRDNMVKINERELVDLVWALGTMGGVSSAICYLLKYITSFVSNQLYHGTLIRKLYHLERYPEITKLKLM